MALPFSESRREPGDHISANLLAYIPLPPPLRRRQEVDRVNDGYSRHSVLGAEIHGLDALHHLIDEIRRFHVRRLQRAHRYAAVGLDRQPHYHLPLQRGVVPQLSVVQPVERRLVAVEDDLYFFVGSGRTGAGTRLGPVTAADGGDRADGAAYRHAAAGSVAAAPAAAAGATSAAPAATTAATASAASA